MGGAANIERHHKAGRLTVRERISRCCSTRVRFTNPARWPDKRQYDEQGHLISFTPSNFVAGTGRIDGRPVVVGGDDFTVRGGAADASIGNKMGHAEKLARGMRMPMVRLVDGTGGGGSVKTIETIGRTYVPANPAWDTITAMLGEVPVVGACLGPVAGLGRGARGHVAFFGDGARIEPAFCRRSARGGTGRWRKSFERATGRIEIHARGERCCG